MATKAELTKALSDLLDAAEYLDEGGALDSLSHAPDSGEKWHRAVSQAQKALGLPYDADYDDEDDE